MIKLKCNHKLCLYRRVTSRTFDRITTDSNNGSFNDDTTCDSIFRIILEHYNTVVVEVLEQVLNKLRRHCMTWNTYCLLYLLDTVHCGWSAWGTFSSCSVKCGWGTIPWARVCNSPTPICNGNPCLGSNQDIQPCNEQPCPREWKCTLSG